MINLLYELLWYFVCSPWQDLILSNNLLHPLYVDMQYNLKNLQRCRYFEVTMYRQFMFLIFKIYQNVLLTLCLLIPKHHKECGLLCLTFDAEPFMWLEGTNAVAGSFMTNFRFYLWLFTTDHIKTPVKALEGGALLRVKVKLATIYRGQAQLSFHKQLKQSHQICLQISVAEYEPVAAEQSDSSSGGLPQVPAAQTVWTAVQRAAHAELHAALTHLASPRKVTV